MIKRICWAVIVLLLIARPAGAQESGQLSPGELAQAAEARHLLAAYGGDVWPGLGDEVPPYLLRKGDYEFLIGHPAPPDGFERLPGVTVDGEPVYRLDGHLTPQPIASSWPVGDLWAAALPVRDDLQPILDAMLGPGVVVLDDALFVRVLTHEAFHAFQIMAWGGLEHFPDVAAGPADMDWLAALSEEELSALDAAHAAEGQALRAALDAETPDEARRAAAQFLLLREIRRVGAAPDLIAYERAVEWTEGPARFVEVSLAQIAGGPDYAPAPDTDADYRIAFPPPDRVWADYLDQLSDPGAIPGGIRERYTAMGAGQAFVLDRLLPGWQDRALHDGIALEDLLMKAVAAGLWEDF